jgi:protein-disulfide isomerase
MKLFRALTVVTLCFLVAAFNVGCKDSTSKAQFDKQVHDYLINNPEILIEMSNKLQEKMQEEQSQKAVQAIKENSDALFNKVVSPVTGNKSGAVTLIEFFDYQCIHCAKMYPVVKNLIQANQNLRVVSKEFPIFGKESQYAAAAALAANIQGKFLEMHNALYDSGAIEGKMTIQKVDAIAQKIGLNLAKMKKDMKSAAVQDELKANLSLATQLGIRGTPAFIIAPTDIAKASKDKITFIPGGAQQETLQQAVDKAK